MEQLLTCEATGRLRAQAAAVLLCALVAACATTQRSSTSGAGRTSESARPPVATSASEPAPPASTASVAAAPAPKTPASADEGGPMQFPTDSNGTQVNDQAETATETTQATTQAKQQLANEDTAISELHKQHEADASQMQAEPAEESAPAPAGSAGQSEVQPEQHQEARRTPNSVAAVRNEEQAAQFPENKQDAPETARRAARNDATAAANISAAVWEPADRSVYFNYDEATVLAKYDAMLMADAAYLGAHPDQSVEVQGNCDERGSREYNLALGARRAESVKRALELGGVASSRIHAISFGAEKPVAMGHDEDSWSQNRRADIVDK